MANNGGQIVNIGNHCKNADVTVRHHTATITRNGNQEHVPLEMNVGNDSDQLTANVDVNLSGGNPQQLQQQDPQVTGVSRQCSEDREARQAVSEASDNDDKYISCQRKPTNSYHETSPKTTV